MDTSAWYALNDRDGQHREQAIEKYRRIKDQRVELITSDYIFDECLTLLGSRIGHKPAVDFGEALLRSSYAELVTVTVEDRQAAFALFKKYADKDLSFTYCTSFALMKRSKLKVAFTFDSHLQQVGFEVW